MSPFNYDPEQKKILSWIENLKSRNNALSVLDVGCGYGRFLKPLRKRGISAVGVEVNPNIITSNRKEGLECLSPEEIAKLQKQFDVILMSHIVEHFNPTDLIHMLDGYVDKLRTGGALIIATPLLTRYFYNDFDHIRPYPPTSLIMMFDHPGGQVQFQSKHRLKLEHVWFRRASFRTEYLQSHYVKSPLSVIPKLINYVFACLYVLSCGKFGQRDAWCGLFRKVTA